MSGCFLPGTDLGKLEAGMQQIPSFQPRRCGVIRGRPEKTADVPYGELVLLFVGEIPPSRLAVRIINLKNRGEVKEFMFRSGQHKKRFREICGNGDYVSLCADHGRAAALFLLSADTFLWNQAKPCITKNGIRYREMAVHGIEPDGYALLCAAKEMCGGRPGLSLSELGDPELISDRLLQVILTGILISRHGIGIMAEKEERKGRGPEKKC
nr:hypothetical protein [uncultured Acetatifactor sp.]